jgi:hypothetical protein
MPRKRGMFIRPKRRRWVAPVVGLAVVAAAAAGVARLVHRPTIEVTGTITAITPLACAKDARDRFAQGVVVFGDQEGRELGRASGWSDVRAETERVRGFAHCRLTGTYRVRLPKSGSYVVTVPDRQLTVGSITFDRLKEAGFRYDIMS